MRRLDGMCRVAEWGSRAQPPVKMAFKEHRRAAALGISTCWCSAHTRMCSDYSLVQTRPMGSARRIRSPCDTRHTLRRCSVRLP